MYPRSSRSDALNSRLEMLPLRPRFVMGMVRLPGEKAGGVCEIMPRKSSAPQPMESLRGMLPALPGIDTEAERGQAVLLLLD